MRMTMTVLVGLAVVVFAAGDASADEASQPRQFTFSWQFLPDDTMRPRGGTSRGTPVRLISGESAAWKALREPGISEFERDRRAILAMAGGYRTSFDFIETVGFAPGYEPSRPYQSWSTEYVDVIADTGREISLQHTIVMEFEDADGNVRGPFVQKHWRQDWRYEDASLHEYAGHGFWREREVPQSERRGRWSQAVYQVDDSPRYEALGNWHHAGGYSAWTSDSTWRPLPRRESSVRDDYDVLIAINRHTITPTGWVHEEENLKARLADDGALRADMPYVARELGLNRYELIEGFDFAAREGYWQATAAFWADVREAWSAIKARMPEFVFTSVVDGVPLFQPMFEYAAGLEAGQAYDADEGREMIRETLDRYVSGGEFGDAVTRPRAD